MHASAPLRLCHRFLVRVGLLLLLVGLMLCSPSPPAAYAAAHTVTTVADSGAGSLRQAILEASPGDTITFHPSLSGGTIALASTLILDENLTIDGSTLAEPVTVSGGSAVRVFDVLSVTVHLRGLTIANGHAPEGGGIRNAGSLTVADSTVAACEAARGGGILNLGALTLTGSTLHGNSAVGDGGGVHSTGQRLTIVNSTLAENTAGRYGGGLYHSSYGDTRVTHATFSGNGALAGGGIYHLLGTLQLENSIVANSPSGGDCANLGAVTAGAGNLVEDGTCGVAPLWPDHTDPVLAPLADNGGPTQTFALLPASPASNGGDEAFCLPTDQRGVVRPQGGGCDSGSYEQRTPLDATVGEATGVTETEAVLHGTVSAPDWASVECVSRYHTEWGSAASGSIAGSPSAVTDAMAIPVVCRAAALTPGTRYDYHIVVTNGAGSVSSQEATFTTRPLLPTVSTGEATEVWGTQATVWGLVNARSLAEASMAYFQYGLDTDYGLRAPDTPCDVTGNYNREVWAWLSGLQPTTTYHYRLVATNSAGTVYGADVTFTTTVPPPIVTIDQSVTVRPTSAIVQGTVDAQGSHTYAEFVFGDKNGTYTLAMPVVLPGGITGTGHTRVHATLINLRPDTTYFCLLSATNDGGLTQSEIVEFTTTTVSASIYLPALRR